MIKKARTSLGAILSLAMDSGLVAQNVVRARGRTKRNKRVEGGKLKVGIDIPSTADIRVLLPQLQGYLRPLILTAAFAGLRWSELRGLTWANVDLKTATLAVTQRMDRYGAIGAPKSEAGERTVPLLGMVVQALREWKLASPSNDLVFVNSQGNPLHRNTVVENFAAAQIAAWGVVKYPGLHALRHFFASWCLARRADGGRELPIKTVQGLMGHASITMTCDTYGHLFPAQNDAAELVAAEKAFLLG
jgi:integrase